MIKKEELLEMLAKGPAERPLDDFLDRYLETEPGTRAQVARRLTAALSQVPGCARGVNKSVVYLPWFRTGATMIQPFPQGNPHHGAESLRWLPEVLTLFNPTWSDLGSLTLEAARGLHFSLRWRRGYGERIPLPRDLAIWLRGQENDYAHDALEIHCLDGRKGRFRVRSIKMEGEDREVSDARLRKVALEVLAKHRNGQEMRDVARETLAHGIYHHALAPHPLMHVLTIPVPTIRRTWSGIEKLPDMSSNLYRLLEAQDPAWAIDDELYWRATGGMMRPPVELSPAVSLGAGCYRIRVRMEGHRVSWLLEVASDHTFYDLHLAIMSVTGFDNDHLWVFSLAGRPRDHLASIGPDIMDEVLPAEQIEIGEVGLAKKQKFGYVFDMGDWWVFHLEVIDFIPGEDIDSPRVIEQRGTPPEQYPSWDDEE